jgi:LmbE family N-acetylglucosaminyl deacetylase
VLDDSEVERVLAVTAHPDDVDFGAAGTVRLWTRAGIEVVYCVCTDGDAGGFDLAVDRSGIPATRRAEQEAAAKELGVDDVRFLGYRDGQVHVTLDLRCDIARVIREVRPQRLLTQSPRRNYTRIAVSHPDHMAVGEATLCAVYPDARNPFAFPELAKAGLEAWVVSEVWIAGDEQPDHFVDVTDVFDRKLAALRAHVSQTGHMDDLEGLLRGFMGLNAATAGFAAGRLAEAYRILPTG